MAKIIVERPRRAGVTTKGVGRVRNIEDLPRNQGMTRPHRMNWGGKELNENLAPLRRFLHSRVGHKWDEVYSEICENLKVTSAVQQHVRDHVTGFVVVRTQMINNEIWECDGSSPCVLSNYTQLYVHPITGILCKNPGYREARSEWKEFKQQRAQAEHDISRCVAGVHLRKVDGIWYEADMQPVPAVTFREYVTSTGEVRRFVIGGSAYDVVLRTSVDLRRPGYGHGVTHYAAHKRQLNNGELRKYGVDND